MILLASRKKAQQRLGSQEWYFKSYDSWDFSGSPVVKTLPSNAGGASSIPGQGAKIPHASWPKKAKY